MNNDDANEVMICCRCERTAEMCECLPTCPLCDQDECDCHDDMPF